MERRENTGGLFFFFERYILEREEKKYFWRDLGKNQT